ncbi:MAG: U3 small nucleolar RNA-associated protein 13 [Bathelium mastoideum]|nr:MAG: U3 small nucleolar RNA-associated protein 13 [Bathelium mastoideum]
MAQRTEIKTTFEIDKVIQPFYSGGGVALGQDGRTLATCLGEDVVLTDLTIGHQLLRIDGDGEPLTAISVTPDGSHLITCSRSLTVRIYLLQPSDDAIVAELQRTLKPHNTPTITTAVDRTSTLFAVGAADGAIKVFDIRGGYTTHTFHGHSGVISALHFFEVENDGLDRKSQNSKKRKKRRSNGETMDIDDPKEEATAGFRLASGGEDGKIRIWDLHQRKSIAVLDSHVSVVRGLHFSDKENALVSGSRDKTVMLWDAKNWKLKSTIPVLESIESVGFVREGAFIYTGGENGCVRLWSTMSGTELTAEQEVTGENEAILDVIQSGSHPFLLSVHADQSLRLHSLAPLDEAVSEGTIPPLPTIRRISGTHDEVIDLAYVGMEKSFLALATNLEELRIISLAPQPRSPHINGIPKSLSNPADNSYFGADVSSLRGHTDIIITLDTDWSGHWLATGAKDNTVRLWRLDPTQESYTCYATFSGHAESIGAVALPHHTPPLDSGLYKRPLDSPPKFLLTGSQDKTIKRWDIPVESNTTAVDGAIKVARAAYTRKAHDKDINALDANPNSTLFASASQDRTVKIWDIEAGETIGILRGHKRGVWTARFSPLGTPSISGESGATTSASRGYVVTGSGDKTVRIWSLTDYSCLRTFEGHTNSVLKVLWLPTPTAEAEIGAHGRSRRGPQVASAAGDGLVKIWDVQEGELATTLDNHTDRVWALAVKPGRTTTTKPLPQSDSTDDTSIHDPESTTTTTSPTVLLSAGADGVLTFWHDTSTTTLSHALARSAARLEADQTLQNLIRARAFGDAVALALQLDHPARLLQLFTDAAAQNEGASLTGAQAVDDMLARLEGEQLWKLLLRVREWNTSARRAGVAQRVLNAVVKLVPVERMVRLRPARGWGKGKGGRKEGVREVVDGLRAYSERHLERVERMREEGFLVGYTLQQMDEGMGVDGLDGLRGLTGSENTGRSVNGESKDVEMVD